MSPDFQNDSVLCMEFLLTYPRLGDSCSSIMITPEYHPIFVCAVTMFIYIFNFTYHCMSIVALRTQLHVYYTRSNIENGTYLYILQYKVKTRLVGDVAEKPITYHTVLLF